MAMTTTQFTIQPEIFTRFPGIRIAVAVARNVDNTTTKPQIEAQWRAAWQAAAGASVYGNAQAHPHVRPWREHFTAMGVSGKQFPSSIEAILRRAMKGGEPFTINPLVDFYNSISLRHIVPVGGFDLAQLCGPIELRLTQPGDTFLALDAAEPLPVDVGEVAYTDGQIVLTRHFVWRQAKTGLLDTTTRDVFLVSEILGEVGQDVAAAVVAELRSGLADLFGGVVLGSWLLDAEHPSITWQGATSDGPSEQA